MDNVPGGLTKQEPATPEIQKISDEIKWQVENKTGKIFQTFKAVSYRSQVVAGMNYFIKVHVWGDKYLHMRVFEALPSDGGQLELAGVQENKTLQDPIEPF